MHNISINFFNYIYYKLKFCGLFVRPSINIPEDYFNTIIMYIVLAVMLLSWGQLLSGGCLVSYHPLPVFHHYI